MYKIIGADNKEYGPISPEQMRQWISEGRVNAQTLVWSETSNNWKPLRTYPEFFDQASLSSPTAAAVPPAAAFPAPASNNKMAFWGMIMGICSLVFSCCCYGLPFNILGVVFSTIALSQIKQDPTQSGRSQAKAGLILSIVSIVLAIAMVFIGSALLNEEANEKILKMLEELLQGR